MKRQRWQGLLAAILGVLVAFPAPAQEDKDREALAAAVREAERLKQQGQYAEAVQEYERAVTLAGRVLGPEHPTTATVLNNLGRLYYTAGQFPRAASVFQKSLQVREAK